MISDTDATEIGTVSNVASKRLNDELLSFQIVSPTQPQKRLISGSDHRMEPAYLNTAYLTQRRYMVARFVATDHVVALLLHCHDALTAVVRRIEHDNESRSSGTRASALSPRSGRRSSPHGSDPRMQLRRSACSTSLRLAPHSSHYSSSARSIVWSVDTYLPSSRWVPSPFSGLPSSAGARTQRTVIQTSARDLSS